MRDAERRIEPEHAREASRFEKLAEALTRQVESSRVEMMRRLDAAETEGRVERIERALAAIGEQARAAEQRSVAAVEGMGHEIMRIARNLNGRVEKVEATGAGASDARVAALEQKLERDLARHAQAVDQRLTQADDQHALALERLGGEIARISDRLGERIAQSERRSAQALDDIGRRLAESTDKMHQRHERASGELAERMRQSEERTARLLAEARDSIEQRAGRTERRDVPLESSEPAPGPPLKVRAAIGARRLSPTRSSPGRRIRWRALFRLSLSRRRRSAIRTTASSPTRWRPISWSRGRTRRRLAAPRPNWRRTPPRSMRRTLSAAPTSATFWRRSKTRRRMSSPVPRRLPRRRPTAR
ncbi:hypothetical protein V8F63_03430 [Brevundimonas sp. LF-1]|uniref:hypothetical protein n=1 Tax=Brevundimonas sp. LF-1 TaxID=3126100 RepID=UPI0030DE195E